MCGKSTLLRVRNRISSSESRLLDDKPILGSKVALTSTDDKRNFSSFRVLKCVFMFWCFLISKSNIVIGAARYAQAHRVGYLTHYQY